MSITEFAQDSSTVPGECHIKCLPFSQLQLALRRVVDFGDGEDVPDTVHSTQMFTICIVCIYDVLGSIYIHVCTLLHLMLNSFHRQ